MSTDSSDRDSSSDDGPRGNREVAHRVFAAEFDECEFSHTESDEERAPNYVVTPTGGRVNRMFVVGTLTEVTDVNEEMVRARVVGPTGAFVVYAGQYQPEALATLERLDPPAFVAVTGKARTFEPDDGDRVYTSVRPETVAEVDGNTRDAWVVDTARRTLERIDTYAQAATVDLSGDDLALALDEVGVVPALANGIPLAEEFYETTPGYLAALREVAIEATEVVAGGRREVAVATSSPNEDGGSGAFTDVTEGDDLARELERDAVHSGAETAEEDASTPGGEAADPTAKALDNEPDPNAVSEDDVQKSPEEPSSEELTSSSEGEQTDPIDDTGDEEELGDFGGLDTEPTTDGEPEPTTDGEPEPTTDGEPETGDDGLYELDEEERAAVESEFGTDFSTGADVEDPGEAGIDVPTEEDVSDEPSGAPVDDEGERSAGSVEDGEAKAVKGGEELEKAPDESETEDESAADDDSGTEGESATEDESADVDLQSQVIETMGDLDDGDGADREELIDRVTDELAVPPAEVEDAIQDALMGGQCYEPGDGTLKAI